MADTPQSLEGLNADEIAEMAATYQAGLNNPETRELMLRVTKKLKPNVSIPEIDLRDAARGEFKKVDDRQAALEQQIRERDARDRVRDERDRLREQGFSKDEVAAVEKIMMDEHIPSYETAAKYYKAQQTVAEPRPHVGGAATTYSMPKDPLAALKGGKSSLNKWSRDQATQDMDDIRSGRIKLS